MNIIEKMKKEIRMTVAIINFLSFFLPWVAVSATSSTSVCGEIFSGVLSRFLKDCRLQR